MQLKCWGFWTSLNPKLSRNGQWTWFISLVIISGITALPVPNPKPFLLVNRGEINIHDSVQRVGHSNYKSNGGRVRYWNLGLADTEMSPRQGKALTSDQDEDPRRFSNRIIMSADSIPTYSQDNSILRRDSGFQPSLYPVQNLENPQANPQQKPDQQVQNYQQQQIPPASSAGGGYSNTQHQVTYQNPSPSTAYGPQSGGQHSQQQPQHQFQGPQRNTLKKFISGIKGKVSKAIKTVKNAFKSIIFKKSRRHPVQKDVGIGYNRRNNLFGVDFWNLDSPLGRLYRWFNNNPLV